MNRFGYNWYRPVIQRKLKRLVKDADVVHALAGGYIGWAAEASAREHGVPFICTPFVHPKQWGDGVSDVAYYNRADAVIGLVQSDRDYLASIGVSEPKLRVIGVSPDLPPTSDPAAFRAKHGLGDDPVVLFVGRMTAYKGAVAVMQAAKIVWEEKPDTHFVFIGPASEEERASFANCDPRIQYLGKVSLEEKASALAACDIFCMPSVSEILPTVYLEAWSYGKPVVGGTAHGLAELVEGNGAGMVAKQDAGAVAHALLVMLRNPELRSAMGDCGKRLVQDKYAVSAVTGALEDLYGEAISRRRAA
jgi:glycosyltransferase involved in cell wall biosynthesis